MKHGNIAMAAIDAASLSTPAAARMPDNDFSNTLIETELRGEGLGFERMEDHYRIRTEFRFVATLVPEWGAE